MPVRMTAGLRDSLLISEGSSSGLDRTVILPNGGNHLPPRSDAEDTKGASPWRSGAFPGWRAIGFLQFLEFIREIRIIIDRTFLNVRNVFTRSVVLAEAPDNMSNVFGARPEACRRAFHEVGYGFIRIVGKGGHNDTDWSAAIGAALALDLVEGL